MKRGQGIRRPRGGDCAVKPRRTWLRPRATRYLGGAAEAVSQSLPQMRETARGVIGRLGRHKARRSCQGTESAREPAWRRLVWIRCPRLPKNHQR